MRIERASQPYQGYKKSTDLSTSSKTFGQVMQTTVQDRYIPSTNVREAKAETEFPLAERTHGHVTVSNATHAKLKQLAEINKQVDYTGMSSEEIYAEIWNRYNKAFDGNMVAITALIAGPAEWGVVNNQFVQEIYEHVIRPEERAARINAGVAQANTSEERWALESSCNKEACRIARDAFLKVLGYDGMNFAEREAAIKEKYAGKNTTLDFLKMQSELEASGFLEHKMGDEARTYCAIIGIQFDDAFNPNSIDNVGPEKYTLMTADQWYRVANQPFDKAGFAATMKEHLGRIGSANGYTGDIVKMMEDCIDQFVKGVIGNSFEELIGETKK